MLPFSFYLFVFDRFCNRLCTFRAHLTERQLEANLDWWLVLIHTRTHRLAQLGSTDFPFLTMYFYDVCFDASTLIIIQNFAILSILYTILFDK